MALLSRYAKHRTVCLKEKGLSNREAALRREGVSISRVLTVQRFYTPYGETGSIDRRKGSGRPTLLNPAVLQMIEDVMQRDDQTTAIQIRSYLAGQGHELSLTTIRRGRCKLGWTFRGSAYCQLIRQANKEKQFQWGRAQLDDDFKDVLWTDETSMQLECHKRFCCRKKGERPRPKPHTKHPVKVHMWAGIGWHECTDICIFDGTIDAPMYISILQAALLPTLQRTEYESGHRFMQDNDPNHTSRLAKSFLAENGVNWWHTPTESPDANPIENLWHELKVSKINKLN